MFWLSISADENPSYVELISNRFAFVSDGLPHWHPLEGHQHRNLSKLFRRPRDNGVVHPLLTAVMNVLLRMKQAVP